MERVVAPGVSIGIMLETQLKFEQPISTMKVQYHAKPSFLRFQDLVVLNGFVVHVRSRHALPPKRCVTMFCTCVVT